MTFSQCMWGKEGVALLFIILSIFFASFGLAYASLESRFQRRDQYRLDVHDASPSVGSPDACDRESR